MRLINVDNFNIEEFYGSNIPKYAILSHTWGVEEASFRQWSQQLTRIRKMRRPGFSKVIETCKHARQDGLAYAWVDTVCIDKSSSAELSEAINSMYAWYQKASVCYVHLGDVSKSSRDDVDNLDLVRLSRWFTRGWTLQELIAPAHVVFYTSEWSLLGTKNALAAIIARVTGIETVCLQRRKRVDEYSIAQRMAWAASRVTTREEDMAYCLLGIFGISMPLLYGEGGKAFMRLQEEIIKASDDHSIFAFDTTLSDTTLFAHHPSAFAARIHIHANFASKLSAPFTMTNAGLAMKTPLIQTLSPYWVLAPLNCAEVEGDSSMSRAQIYLPLFGKDNTFMRGRTPMTLISKKLDEGYHDAHTEIRDLTTRTETSYLISSFSRVYSIHGNEMDEAIKGFDVDDMGSQREQGFMLAFPRGMGNYQLCGAFPAHDVHSDISFFIPTAKSDPAGPTSPYDPSMASVRGIVLFKDDSVQPPRHVAVYLAVEARPAGRWTCRIMSRRDPEDNFDHDSMALHLKTADASGHHHAPRHYDHTDDAIVAARTQFKTTTGQPCKEAILVEIVFDVDTLAQEQDLEWMSLGAQFRSHGGASSTHLGNSSTITRSGNSSAIS
jgi:hypothetical protein